MCRSRGHDGVSATNVDEGAPRRPLRLMPGLLTLAIAAILAMTSTTLLFGHAIYPSSPLLPANTPAASANGTCSSASDDDDAQCTVHNHLSRQRWKLSLATASFASATILRLTVVAPLMRLQDNLPPLGVLSSAIHHINAMADSMERWSHEAWEEAATQSNAWRNDRPMSASHREPPELDLDVLVPCQEDGVRAHLMSNDHNPHDNLPEEGVHSCRLRDVITRSLLVDYCKRFHDEEFDLTTHPVVLRNVWPPVSFDDDIRNGTSGGRRRLTPTGILKDPQLSNLALPNYFSDATKSGYDALVPDEDAITLSQFLRGIQSGKTPNAKIGTQVIVEEHSELRDEIVPPRLARDLFGWSTRIDDWKESMMRKMGRFEVWIRKLPALSYYPVFIAANPTPAPGETANAHPRTDLHAEPIGNVASQLHGTRQWTLVPTKWSGLLRPTASFHRGYFYSNLDPLTELPERLDRLPLVYRCVTRRGDVVWVPPWVWHRVDYLTPPTNKATAAAPEDKQSLSIGASIFHFYPVQYVANFPLFGGLIVPNLIMEVLGLNVE